jgi:hypothetical protein
MAWGLLAGAARAALPAVGRTLTSNSLKGNLARSAVGSALSKRQQSPSQPAAPAAPKAPAREIGQNPGIKYL